MQAELERWINKDQLSELLSGTSNCPSKLLGVHPYGKGQVVLAYRPCAWGIRVKEGRKTRQLERVYDTELFGAYFPKPEFTKKCKLEVQYGEDNYVVTEDAYNFDGIISEADLYVFGEGNHYEIYNKLGAHPMTIDGVKGTHFAVWAPNARMVSVVGDFNMWDARIHPMNHLGVSGIYELFIPGVLEGSVYKFSILPRHSHERILKSDPYGNSFELRPKNASVVADINSYQWKDTKWMKKRAGEDRMSLRRQPMSIYECHLGSWRKHDDGTEDGFYNYREIAHELADYLIEMGYTHVELMGIAEHPFDGSWGYQVTGYYAPTKRYGIPEDFMYFIDYMHQRGIYVILDWVPAHFPRDAFALARFDGQPLYEHPDPRRGEHPDWGTYIFNYSKKEVENFLIANALFWLEKFHADGLRVDAVASMLYLDYGKQGGNWLPNEEGGNQNWDAVRFMQHMNKVVEERVPGAIMVAEESTAWAGVTAPASLQGLGFGFKWNMGWMNDFLEYMKMDPYFRGYNHNKLTFSIMYAYSENFIQVLSHDEVVHGKCSMINKMPGLEYDKFANLRTAYGFMYTHPGKKLLFMGQEFAQYREWSEERALDWELLGEPMNKGMQKYIQTMNHLYQDYDAFYYNDYDQMGFEWIECNDNQRSIVSFIRRGSSDKKQLLVVCNFTPVAREGFQVGVPCKTKYVELINSDRVEFGGHTDGGRISCKAKASECNGKKYSITFDLAPLSMIIFEYDYISDEELQKQKEAKKAAKAAKLAKAEAEAKKAEAEAKKAAKAEAEAKKAAAEAKKAVAKAAPPKVVKDEPVTPAAVTTPAKAAKAEKATPATPATAAKKSTTADKKASAISTQAGSAKKGGK